MFVDTFIDMYTVPEITRWLYYQRFQGSMGSTRCCGDGESFFISFPGVGAGGVGRGDGVGLGVGWEGCLGLPESRFISILRNIKFFCWQLGIYLPLTAGYQLFVDLLSWFFIY